MRNRLARGFTLVEVAVAAALIAILAAATVPTFVDFLDQRDVETTAKTLSSLATGLATYQSTVRTSGTNATYPHRLYELSTTIVTTDSNSCGVRYSAVAGGAGTLVSTWTTGAPYAPFVLQSMAGYQTPIGLIQDLLVRSPNNASVGTLAIVMPTIDSVDALRLERYVDGDDGKLAANQTAGTFRINSFDGNGHANVSYVLPVANKC